MNKIHRVIWNVRTGTWVVVAETTHSRGKGGGRAVGKALLAALISSGLGVESALADQPATTVIPASGKTNAYISANGVPVVNIDTANASGLSHNRYTRYDVEANGLVLNNGNNSQIARQSQLAGQVTSNLNLVKEATVILNEVVSVNRSTLAGFTEVLGGKADVIVANPYGITCDGCGFINTDRATLTTGTSSIGADGSLTGFNVKSGDVLIGAKGANAQQILDIVTRSVKVEGNIITSPTGKLGITTGTNSWNYNSRNTTGTVAADGAAPSYAIDSTALGGMYAGRIRIIATEAGVGVRMLGEAAASADDFTISSAGKVEIQSAISAARDIAISSTSTSGSGDVFVKGVDAKISAGHDLDIVATNGQVKLSEGELYAANNMAVTAETLSDVSTTDKARYAEADNTLVTSGEASIDGSVWGAGKALSGTFDSLSVGANGATIHAGTTVDLNTTNDLALANAAVRSTGDMALASSAGTISTTSGADQGIQTTNGNLSLTAGNGLNNAGTITSDTGSVTAGIDGTLNNSGELHAKTTLDIADKANTGTENITNSGTLIADGSISVNAASVNNQVGATVQGTTGTTVTATELINAGTFIASDTAGQSGNFTLSSFNNSGTLQSKEDLVLNVIDTLDNTGKLLATQDLSVNAGTSALAISNTNSGVIQAGDRLSISGANATFDTQSGTVLGNTTDITLSRLDNSGTLQSNADIALAIGNGLVNSGTLLAKTTLSSNSGSLTNSGTLQANQGSTIGTGALSNTGKIIASDSSSAGAILNVATLSNTGAGVIQSAQNLAINVSGSSLTNANTIIAARDLSLTSTGAGATVTNQNGGFIQAGSTNGDTLTIGGTAVALNNNSGANILADQLVLSLSSLTNAGLIQGGAGLSTLVASGAVDNSGTLTLATSGTGTSNITANSLDNSGTLQSAAEISLVISNLINNLGTLFSTENLTTNSGSLTNSGTLQTNQSATITTGALANSGQLIASGSSSQTGTLNVSTLSNTGSGVIQSAQNLVVNLSGASLTNASKIIANNDLTLMSTGSGLAVTNQSGGYLQAGSATGDTLTIGGNNVSLTTLSGSYALGDELAFTLASLSNTGVIQGGAATSTINVSGNVVNNGTLTLADTNTGGGTITANSINNIGTLQSQGDAALNVATSVYNSGQLLTGSGLSVRGTDSYYIVSNTGRMQSGGLLDVKGLGGGSDVDITVGSSGVMLGNTVGITANNLNINNGAMLTSLGAMRVGLDTLTFGGSSSKIVGNTSGGATTSITLANGFNNTGAIHSSGILDFNAPWIYNTPTGGFSALDTLNLNATGGPVDNSGALYAGTQLNASATGTFTNYSTGTIDSNGSLNLIAGTTFTNNNRINALQDITIVSTSFNNVITGGVPSRHWDGVSWDPCASTANCNGRWTITSMSGSWGWPDDATEYYKRWGSETQYFSSSIPSTKPQIIANRNMTISGFTSAVNGGGVLAANSGTLIITGTGTFTNDDLSLESRAWSETAHQYQDCDLVSCEAGVYTYDTAVKVTSAQANPYTAGIYANTLVATGFGLVNRGSPWATSTTTRTASGSASTSLSNGTSGTGGVTGSSMTGASSGTSGGLAASGITTTGGAPAVSFSGLVIALPINPNGYFVISQDPNSTYLIEANPLFAVGSNFVGSDYMANRYGYNPDTVIKRLGDSNYEAYLIQQQLISQTGNNIIKGYGNEADQMKRLMDQAVTEGESAGFVFGETLTSSQIANLESDVVWMVETTVAGQKVLAPVVYLSAATRDSIETGAVIAGNNVEMNLTTVSNTGGTISGANSLNITAQGDITNTSGTIKGGDVSIKSIEGSIENKTLVSGSGGAENYATSIGKTAGIEATGDLDLDAKKDITVLGAKVKAGGDASLAAGGNVTFDTIVDKTTDTTHSSSSNGLQTITTSNTTTTENNIGSTLVSGGNLKIKSGGDTTIAGSNATVGGDLSVDAGGDFNVLSRQDKTTSKTVTETSGLGVGGGVAGTEKTTTDDFKGTNSGSTLTVGGNATVKADKSMTVQGSDVTIAGDADINAKEGINILDGLDETRTNTVTETTTYMKIGSAGESDSGSDSSSDSQSGPGRANATASAEASAEASGTSDIKFAETTKTSTQAGTNTSVSSNFKVGGNLKAETEGTIKVQGSNVESGGDMELDAKNVEVLTGRNEEWTNTQTVRTSVGIYNEGEASAEAGADAQAKAGTAGTDASASANASAEASGTTTIGARTENEETTDYSLTNSSSTLKSGGSMSIKAKEAAVFVGAEVESGGDMNIEATDIINRAAEDITLKTSSKETNTAGLYIDGEVSAEAGAEADAGKINVGGDPANAEAGGEVSADVSAGVRFKNEKESSIEGSVTNVTTSFKSGGDFTRKAENTIVDQGTQIEAGGDINQSAREIKEIEANDSTFSSKDSSSHDAKIGVGASASAEASGNAKGETESDAGAGAGLRAKYEGSIDSESESTTTAVTTKYKSGGSINSKSEEKTTLIGTQFESGGDINIEAGSLEYKAAKDTTSMSSDANKIDAELKVDVVGKAGGSLEASYGNEGESGSTSTARTGSINAGGNLNIKTKDDASFEGTNIEAGGKADIAAGGNVDFKAARDTAESSKSTIDASVELSSSKGSKGVAASGGYSQEDSSSSTAQAGSIKAGSGGINISAGKDASFEGTKLKSDGDTAVDAGDNVNLKAAKSTATTTSFGVEGSIGAEKGSEGSKKEGSISGNAAYANKVDSDATSIDSGGKVSIKGKNVVNQEANITAKDGKEIIGNEVKIKAEKSDISIGIEASVSGESETEKPAEKKAGE